MFLAGLHLAAFVDMLRLAIVSAFAYQETTMDPNVEFGDTSKTLAGTDVVGDESSIEGEDGVTNFLYGDAWRLVGRATGGDDVITGGNDGAINWIYGDAYAMLALAVGGNDKIVGGMNAVNHLYGDAQMMGWGNQGGVDMLTLGEDLNIVMDQNSSSLSQEKIMENNELIGDAHIMQGSTGGRDTLSLAGVSGILCKRVFL